MICKHQCTPCTWPGRTAHCVRGLHGPSEQLLIQTACASAYKNRIGKSLCVRKQSWGMDTSHFCAAVVVSTPGRQRRSSAGGHHTTVVFPSSLVMIYSHLIAADRAGRCRPASRPGRQAAGKSSGNLCSVHRLRRLWNPSGQGGKLFAGFGQAATGSGLRALRCFALHGGPAWLWP